MAFGASGGVRVGTLMRHVEGPGPYNCLFRNVRAVGGRRGFYAEFETQGSGPARRGPARTAGLRGITWERCIAENAEEPLRLFNVGASTLRDCAFGHAGSRGPARLSFCEDVSLVGCTMDMQVLSEKDMELVVCRKVSVSASANDVHVLSD